VERLALTAESVAEVVAHLRADDDERAAVRGTVADIVAAVRGGGDESVTRLTAALDGVEPSSMRVPAAALAAALDELDSSVRGALELAIANLRAVSRQILPEPATVVLPQGHTVAVRSVPVQRVGIYVPGGRAAYPSSAVMAVVPAQVAGVCKLAVCSPPGEDGLPHATVLAACALLGVEEVYAIGGAQAVAALALGTETIRRVDVLAGPGNAYVEEAKRALAGEVGIESLAGPTELLVIADDSAAPEPLAWDLLAQAEHGSGACSALVATDEAVLDAVAAVVPDDAEGVFLVHAESWAAAYALVNAYAPEHLQLAVADPRAALGRVRHAGAIFLGASSGTAYGDYVAGSNHVLPTGGRARFSSALGPGAFLRLQSVVDVPPAAAAALAGPLAALAAAEGLHAHARSALVRADAGAAAGAGART
jgi:histidinol dehydrogenase